MAVEVTLAIEPASRTDGDKSVIIAADLVKLGGSMVSWSPEMNGVPARARFKFETEADKERFVAEALELRGVSVATLR